MNDPPTANAVFADTVQAAEPFFCASILIMGLILMLTIQTLSLHKMHLQLMDYIKYNVVQHSTTNEHLSINIASSP